VENESGQTRVLAVASAEMCASLTRQLACLDVEVICVAHASEVARLVHAALTFQVVILPAAPPHMEWWTLWGELSLLHPRPSILVYARSTTFQLWAGVLESGAYDLVTEPFSDREIQDAVSRALRNFRNVENISGQDSPD